jgi:uncharacterized tellurite resistance protein B-like protein
MDKHLIETLGKVIIAAAWADQKMAPEEIDNLKDLLFQFRQTLTMPEISFGDEIWAFMNGVSISSNSDAGIGIPARTMAKFEIYTESPVDAAEREWLIHQLREAIWTEEDKTLVISALKDMVQADGEMTEEEQSVLNEIRAMLEDVDTGIIHHMGRLIRNALQRRSQTMGEAPNREKYFEEFLENKVYYELRSRLDRSKTKLDIPDDHLRKLGTVGGMMARVAQVDNVLLDKELDKMTSIVETGWGIMSILQTGWGLSREAALFVIDVAMSEVSKNFDYLRMSRNFYDIATPAERVNLLELLFAVANADGRISSDEFSEIRTIADYLLLSSNRVDEAYSKIVA